MVLIDSYSESNQDWSSSVQTTYISGQSFTNVNPIILDSCKFYIKKSGSPTGNAVAKIYAHTGTYGTSSVPTGSALATSDNFDVSTLSTSYGLSTFNFSGADRITLSANTYYCIVLVYSGGSSSNRIDLAEDDSSPTASGNKVSSSNSGSTWSATSGYDVCFYVYGYANASDTRELINLSLYNDANLIAYYRFEGNSNDTKGSYNGTDTSMSYGSSYGKFGQGAYWPGGATHYIATSLPINDNNTYTINFWVKTTSSDIGIMSANVSGGKWTRPFSVDINSSGYLQAWGSSSEQGPNAVGYSTPINDGSWYFISIVRKKTNTILYVNGSLIGNNSTVYNSGQSFNLTIGWVENGDWNNGTRTYFNGDLDDISIFSRELSATEIANYYIAAFTQSLSETITITENLFKGISKNFLETFTLTEIFSKFKGFSLSLFEIVNLTEKITNNFVKKCYEIISLVDNKTVDTLNNLKEIINFSETISNKLGYYKTLIDNIGLSEKLLRYKNGFILSWKILSKSFSAIWNKETKSTSTWKNKPKSIIRWTKK